MTNQARALWTTPVLEQLSVDLDAIANKGGSGSDGSGNVGKNRS